MKSRRYSKSVENQKEIDRTFFNLTRHLRAKDFQWVQEDLADPECPEIDDLLVSNDNQYLKRN